MTYQIVLPGGIEYCRSMDTRGQLPIVLEYNIDDTIIQ